MPSPGAALRHSLPQRHERLHAQIAIDRLPKDQFIKATFLPPQRLPLAGTKLSRFLCHQWVVNCLTALFTPSLVPSASIESTT